MSSVTGLSNCAKNPEVFVEEDPCKKIQEDYEKALPEKVAGMQKAIEALHQGVDLNALQALRFLVHKMAGSAGTFGYMQVSQLCLVWDRRLSQMIDLFPQCQKDLSWLKELDLFFTQIKQGFSLHGGK